MLYERSTERPNVSLKSRSSGDIAGPMVLWLRLRDCSEDISRNLKLTVSMLLKERSMLRTCCRFWCRKHSVVRDINWGKYL